MRIETKNYIFIEVDGFTLQTLINTYVKEELPNNTINIINSGICKSYNNKLFFNKTKKYYGYNLMVVGRYNHHHSEETKQKMRNSSLGKKKSKEHVHNGTLTKYKAIIQYDLEGNFINEWLGASYVRDKLGYNQGNITAVCNGKRSTAHGYIWKYKN
jgi:hypothetical protein